MALFCTEVFAARGQVTLTVKQMLANAGDDTFSYRLHSVSAPNDDHSFAITGTGEKAIGPLVFTQAGIYSYELSQVTACVCTSKAYTLRIYVENDLSASVVAFNPDGTKATDIQFEHTCGKPKETTRPETTVPTTKSSGEDGPKMGDDSQTAPYIVLLGAAGIAVLSSVIYLLTSRRRRRETTNT